MVCCNREYEEVGARLRTLVETGLGGEARSSVDMTTLECDKVLVRVGVILISVGREHHTAALAHQIQKRSRISRKLD